MRSVRCLAVSASLSQEGGNNRSGSDGWSNTAVAQSEGSTGWSAKASTYGSADVDPGQLGSSDVGTGAATSDSSIVTAAICVVGSGSGTGSGGAGGAAGPESSDCRGPWLLPRRMPLRGVRPDNWPLRGPCCMMNTPMPIDAIAMTRNPARRGKEMITASSEPTTHAI